MGASREGLEEALYDSSLFVPVVISAAARPAAARRARKPFAVWASVVFAPAAASAAAYALLGRGLLEPLWGVPGGLALGSIAAALGALAFALAATGIGVLVVGAAVLWVFAAAGATVSPPFAIPAVFLAVATMALGYGPLRRPRPTTLAYLWASNARRWAFKEFTYSLAIAAGAGAPVGVAAPIETTLVVPL